MTDWSRLRDAYGPADDVPRLLQQVDPNPDAEVWEQLWSRLCHQGKVYPASAAALPALTSALAEWPAAERVLGLVLAAAILAGADRSPEFGDVREHYRTEIARLAQLTTETLRAADPADPTTYIYLLQAALAFDGVPIWEHELDQLADGEYQVPCPSCATQNYIVIGEHGNFSTVEDYAQNNAATRFPLQPATPDTLDGLPETLYLTAHADGQHEVADRLTYLFGHATCGHCKTSYAVPAAISAQHAA
jgi:hypothetical protein